MVERLVSRKVAALAEQAQSELALWGQHTAEKYKRGQEEYRQAAVQEQEALRQQHADRLELMAASHERAIERIRVRNL